MNRGDAAWRGVASQSPVIVAAVRPRDVRGPVDAQDVRRERRLDADRQLDSVGATPLAPTTSRDQSGTLDAFDWPALRRLPTQQNVGFETDGVARAFIGSVRDEAYA
jgi:hypothetical protein